jgi:ACT domain-containing protein
LRSPKQRRTNYKLEIRRLLALGLATEAIARILNEKYGISRTTFYEYLRQIRKEDSVLAESKDRRYIHTDISICRDRLSTLYRNALSRIQDPNTNLFAVAPLLKLAQDIAITLLKLEFEGVQVTQSLNSKIDRAEPYLSSEDNSENHNSNSSMSSPHLKEDDVF